VSTNVAKRLECAQLAAATGSWDGLECPIAVNERALAESGSKLRALQTLRDARSPAARLPFD